METRRRRRRSEKRDLDFEQAGPRPPSRNNSGCLNGICALVLIAATALFLIPRGKEPGTSPPPGVGAAPLNDATWIGPLPKDVIKHFQTATTIEEKLVHLHHLDLVADRAQTFFSDGPGSSEEIVRITKVKGQKNTLQILRFTAILKDGGSRMLVLYLKDGEAKIDFDLYARHCDVPLPEFLKGPASQSMETRLVLSKTHFYAGEFSDEKTWQSFKASSPDLDQSFTVYLKRSQPGFKKLAQRPEAARSRINLALAATPAGRANQQFEITRINSFGWFTLPKPHPHSADKDPR